MSKLQKLKRLKYYLFGERKVLTLKDFILLSVLDTERGISLVQNSRSGDICMKRQLKEYDLAKYRYLKKRPVDNTPKILVLDEADGVLTIIEKYSGDDSLAFLLRKKGVMDENRVIDIARQLCVILNNYHKGKTPVSGHDLHPVNIKLSFNNIVTLMEANSESYGEKNVKIASLPDRESFAAPEREEPNASGVLADVYSMGVLMNILLTGKHPEQQIAEGVLGPVIRRCLALSPAERFQNMGELQAALKSAKHSLSFRQRLSSWKRYLIPGFRQKNSYMWYFAAMGYPMLAYICFGLQFGDQVGLGLLNRLVFFLTVLALVFFNGNYLNVQNHCPLIKSKRSFFHRLGMVVANALILLLAYGAFFLISLSAA